MTFTNYSDTGKIQGPYGSLPLAQKWAKGMIAGDKRIQMVEIRPALNGKGPFKKKNPGSFYAMRTATPLR